MFSKLENINYTVLNQRKKKKIYQAQEPRKIDWPAYNLSQIRQIKESLNFIRESVNYAYCPKVRKNATSPKLLAKAILLSELLQSPERAGEGWVEILGPYVGIHKRIDDWVIGIGSVKNVGKDKIIYIMKITEKMKMTDYYKDNRFKNRCDNIYFEENGGIKQLKNRFHSEKNYIRDNL